MTDKDNQADARPENWDREVLERLAFASLTEQRRARRWGIFFKLFFAILILLLILISSDRFGHRAFAARYTALVDLDGEISSNSQASADNVISGLRAAFNNSATAGVIIRADSPGGSPVQAAYINDEIRRLRAKHPSIPVYAVITDLCASGCYYAIVAADKIYADPSSLVGSIGVLMNGFGFVDAMKKLGISRRLLTAGAHKGFLDPFSPMKPGDRKYALQMLEQIHQQFIARVRQGRGKALKETPNLYSGLIWTGVDARRLGLIDGFGSASYVARHIIGAKEIVDFTHREDVLDRFARRFGSAMANTFAARVMGTPMRLR